MMENHQHGQKNFQVVEIPLPPCGFCGQSSRFHSRRNFFKDTNYSVKAAPSRKYARIVRLTPGHRVYRVAHAVRTQPVMAFYERDTGNKKAGHCARLCQLFRFHFSSRRSNRREMCRTFFSSSFVTGVRRIAHRRNI